MITPDPAKISVLKSLGKAAFTTAGVTVGAGGAVYVLTGVNVLRVLGRALGVLAQ